MSQAKDERQRHNDSTSTHESRQYCCNERAKHQQERDESKGKSQNFRTTEVALTDQFYICEKDWPTTNMCLQIWNGLQTTLQFGQQLRSSIGIRLEQDICIGSMAIE